MDAGDGYKEARHLLDKRYGNPEKIASAYVSKILEWHAIAQDDVEGLDEFALALRTCRNAISTVPYEAREMEHPKTLLKIVEKLPYHIQDRWRRRADSIYEDEGRLVVFEDLVNLVEKEARIALNPNFGRHLMNSKSKLDENKERGWRASKNDRLKCNFVKEFSCWKCGESHFLDKCAEFLSMPYNDREEFLRKKGMCFRCLRRGHVLKHCSSRYNCNICHGNHHTVLHRDQLNARASKEVVEQAQDSGVSILSNQSVVDDGLGFKMLVIPVKARSDSGKVIETYALLDNGSSSTFCKESLIRKLELKNVSNELLLNVSTVTADCSSQSCRMVSGVILTDFYENHEIYLPPMYTLSRIPVDDKDIIHKKDLCIWPHLRDIEFPVINSEIELLIGINVPVAFRPEELRLPDGEGPFAVRTKLGWSVYGCRKDLNRSFDVNRVKINDIQIHEVINGDFNDFTNLNSPTKGFSSEDLWWLKEMRKGRQLESGNYELPLPIKSRSVPLPDSRSMALNRMTGLKRKMKNKKFAKDYCSFMDDMLKEGYAEEVPLNDRDKGRVWYIPHFGVYHPHKPEKIRIVFDCAARVRGLSLNDLLVQGPHLTNSLVEILIKFRKGEYAFSADITKMFYQVQVPEWDRDYLRFFWWKNNDFDTLPSEYRMKVHLFGASSSPACANYSLQRTVLDHSFEFSNEAAETILNNFYVDDCLRAMDNQIDLVNNAMEVKNLCARGGFNLSKFKGSDVHVTEVLNDHGLHTEETILVKKTALGIQWTTNDEIGLSPRVDKCIKSKRTLMSAIASIYDPLGLSAPLILQGRLMLQECCRLNVDWDEKLPTEIVDRIEDWIMTLEKSDLFVNRNIKPLSWGVIVRYEIHHFCDASQLAYGVVSYLRATNSNGKVFISFIFGKAHVAPIKSVSIPRLELTAATLAVKINSLLMQALDIDIDRIVYWTDSMTTLQYIRNETTRYHVFVANRLAMIWDGSRIDQWRFVNGHLNPADEASRGYQTFRWLNGPKFLLCHEDDWPEEPLICQDDLKLDKEVKQFVGMSSDHSPEDVFLKILSYYSSWFKLKCIVAWLIKFKDYVLFKGKMRDYLPDKVMRLNDLVRAERSIVLIVQRFSFAKEIIHLGNKGYVKACSGISKLKPFLDENGLIRVGGRLSGADLGYDEKHPVLLPYDDHVTNMIIAHTHEVVGHSGRTYVLADIRKKYWIVKGNAAVRKVLRKCVQCRKHQSPVCQQVMADLPSTRVSIGDPPFTHTGVDCFGPFYIKQRRSQVKRYGILFTCMTVRAIHVEVAPDLSLSSFINALRRFIARRGPIRSLTCDNGTNFVGAANELRREIVAWNSKVTSSYLLQHQIDWHFNPPNASHFGGVWERQIRTIRKVLLSVLGQQILTDDLLHTLLCEVEAIINGRPITTVTCDVNDLVPLSPAKLLTLREGVKDNILVDSADNYARKRWKQVQYLANLFWVRWRDEYVKEMQVRQKWVKQTRDLKVDDVVLVVDNSLPRGHWCLGRVVDTVRNNDGHVRRVKVRVRNNIIERPLSKLVLVLENDN